MDRETLYDLHKRNGDRPQFYREHRDAFAEHLSETTAAKLPDPDASTFEWRQFINSHKGVITRQLQESNQENDDELEVVEND